MICNLPSESNLNTIVVPVLPFFGNYFIPNKSSPIMSWGWFPSCILNELLHLDEHFPGLVFSQVWVLINRSTYFVDWLKDVNFLSCVYLLAKIPYVRKQCFVWEPLEAIMRSLKQLWASESGTSCKPLWPCESLHFQLWVTVTGSSGME